MTRRLTRAAFLTALPLLLPACAHREVALVTAPPPPLAIVPPPPAPAGLTASLTLPETNPDGSFRTINWGLTPAETVWHMRGALNVAALGCRDTTRAALIVAYNGLLKDQKTVLAAADKAAQAHARSVYGRTWQAAHDQAMTRLYNFFAQPFAQTRFCETAAAIAITARHVPAGQMDAFAATALPALEAPFVDFYRQAADYRRDYALWQAGQQPAVPRIEPSFAGLDRVAVAGPR